MEFDYRLHLLGPVHVEHAGQPVHGFESRRALALLCYLAAQGQPQTRAHLADLFWPDKPEARGRGNLSRVLNNFATLLPGCVNADRETVTFNAAACWLDVAAFTALTGPTADVAALTEAVALYRDDFMAGMYLDDCPDFETWLVVERERWRQKAAAALHTLVAHHTRRGEIETGLQYTDRLLALDPWREEAHRHKMLLLALAGQRSAALKQYELCRRLLAEELGVAPTAETEALYDRIRAEAEETHELRLSEVSGGVFLPLVGRESDHAWLLAQWEAARRGAGGLTLVSGDAGIGKTRLIHEVLRIVAGQGARVLSGRCYEFNRALPYQAIHEALQPAASPALSTVANPMTRLLHSEDAAPAERTALFAAVAAYLRGLRAQRRAGLVLFLDDLHWADTDTLDLLHYLARHLGDAPCWLVGAYRPGETLPDHPLARLIHALNRDARLRTLSLAPLSADDVTRLTARLLDSTAEMPLADYLFHESEGNPFFIAELMEMLREQGILRVAGEGWDVVGALPASPALPARLQDVILQRVQRLDETGQYLLTLAAAHGRPFDAALLAAAGECPPETVETALTLWRERQLARPANDAWDLTHDKIRSTLYQTVPAPLRRLLHARLAAALAALHPEEVASLAYHYDLARQDAIAARYLRLAGDQARLAYAYEQAIACYRRGLALTSEVGLRYALLSGLESAYDMTSDRDLQRHVLDELATLAENGPPEVATPQHQAEVALRQANYAEVNSDYAETVAAAQRAITCAIAASDEAARAEGHCWRGCALRRQGDMNAAFIEYEQAREIAERIDAPATLSTSLEGLANVAWAQRDYAAAEARLERSLTLRKQLGNKRDEAIVHNMLGIVLQRQGNYEGARRSYRQGLELRRISGDLRGQVVSQNNLGTLAYEVGAIEEARQAYAEALRLCQQAEDIWGAAIAQLGLGWTAFDVDDRETAQQHAEASLTGLRQASDPLRAGQAEYLLGRVAQARGEIKTAAARFSAALELWRKANQAGHITLGASALAHACAEQGQSDQAYSLLDQALAALEREPLPAGVVRPLRAYWHCYCALQALENTRADQVGERAADVLTRARTLLQAQAARLPEAQAATFLTAIPEHRALQAQLLGKQSDSR
ncbi:MAG TPA: AAA family ATPase [Anaerolineae bacterium]|nr:AAA family ATPase [Anaerolineae bacterium]